MGGGVTSFTYSSAHLLLTVTNPNGQAGARCGRQIDQHLQFVRPSHPAGRPGWADDHLRLYRQQPVLSRGSTTITDPDGDVTLEDYQGGELVSVTKGYGTSSAATTTYSYGTGELGRRR